MSMSRRFVSTAQQNTAYVYSGFEVDYSTIVVALRYVGNQLRNRFGQRLRE